MQDKYFDAWVKNLPILKDKVIAVTGTTSGTGFWTAVAGIRKNANALILLNRPSKKNDAAFEKLTQEKKACESITVLYRVDCDLMKSESVHKAAKEVVKISEELGSLNVLANNAGIMAFPDVRTSEGYDVQMQTNHLSHFLLTKLLMPVFETTLKGGGEVRIIQHSSGARHGKKLEAKYFEKSDKGKLGGEGTGNVERYHQTKLANVAFALKLHKEFEKKGLDLSKIKSIVAEPGVSETDLSSSMMNQAQGFFLRMYAKVMLFYYSFKMQSAADGALPLIEACYGTNVDSGDFFYPKNHTNGPPFKAISKGALAEGNKKQEPEMLDVSNQDLVWKKSEEAYGPFFEHSKM